MRQLVRLLAFWRKREREDGSSQDEPPLELPWRQDWSDTFHNSAGRGFSRRDYALARERGREVALATLGKERWTALQEHGYLDVPSRRIAGLVYRLRVGRRVEVRCIEGASLPTARPYLCINPTYPLPQEEFLAQLYLYLREREDLVLAVAVPQAYDGPIGRTF